MDNAENSVIEPSASIPQEEMVPKSRVEELIKKAKISATDKTRLEMEDLHAQQLEQLKAQSQGMGGQPAIDVNAILAQAREEARKELQAEREKAEDAQRKESAEKVAEKFFTSLHATDREALKDFDEVVAQVDLRKYPQLVGLLTEFDNTGEMLYELINNGKLGRIDYDVKTDPQYAFSQLRKLSESIKMNKQAIDSHVSTPAPLSHMRPSAKAGTDSGEQSIRDLRRNPKLRG